MCDYVKKELENEDIDLLLFPVIPVGLSTEHKDFCGSITFKPMTYYHMLYDIYLFAMEVMHLSQI